jgi:DNA segregation ATPase FtsK/SpoIIIE-like protein
MVASNRWAEMRPWLRDVLGTRFELRLGDPIDSEINSRFAATVPSIPGRGITPDRLHFLGALPRIDGDTGKTNLLRPVAQAVASHYPPEHARVVFGDFRRQLYDAIPQAHQIGYSVSTDNLAETLKETAALLRERVPGPDIAPSRLPKRDWWTGGRLFVVVDDFELIEGGSDNPLRPLLPLLPQGADIGLHLIVARRTAGVPPGR